MKLQTKTLSTDSLKKVQQYLEVYERVQSFKAEHYEIFQEFAELLQEYNAALEAAEMEVRSHGVTCGPFSVCGETVKIDSERLYDELGEEDFAKVGGTKITMQVLLVDRSKFESLAERGDIPKEILDVVYRRTLRFKAPSKAELP